MDSFWFIIIGMAAGWLAGRTVRDRNLDLAGDMTVGAFCALIGGHLMQSFGLPVRETLLNALLITGSALAVLLCLSLASRARDAQSSLNTLSSYA